MVVGVVMSWMVEVEMICCMVILINQDHTILEMIRMCLEKGYGQDRIYDEGNAKADIIQMLVNPQEVDVLQDNLDLMIRIKETGEKIIVDSYFASYKHKIEQVQFLDGTVWTQTQLETKVMTEGTELNDILNGVNNFADWMYGLGGDDILYASGGNDVLDGGEGNDLLYGNKDVAGKSFSSSNDIYVFGKGYGQDRVFETTYSGVDTIRMLVNPDEVEVLKNNLDLVVRINETGEKITVDSYFSSNVNKIERVEFFDGTIWTQTQLESKIIKQAATKNAAHLKNNSLNDGKEIPNLAAVSTQTEQLIQAMSTFSAISDMDLSQFGNEKGYTEQPIMTLSWTKI